MTVLDIALDTPVSQALGWTLFHSLWEGAAIALAFLAILACFRSPRIRYVSGCVALLLTLVSFAVTLIHFLPAGNHGVRHLLRTTLPPWREFANLNANGAYSHLSVLIPWLAPLWLVGVSIFYVRHAVGWLFLRRIRRVGGSAPETWRRTVEYLASELGISRPVTLLESLFADAPVVLGHLRPVILVPLGFLTGLPPEHVELILLHELAHIRRSDYLVNICQRLMEGLFFYHPAVWWISRVIRAEREHCCDDLVVYVKGDAYDYAVALTAIEENRSKEPWLAHQTAVAATGGNLMKRIKRLLYPNTANGIVAPAAAGLILMATAGIALAAWRANPPLNPAARQLETKAENPWQRWLNEDVVYIISDEERAAFLHLAADAEREHFVEQFWERLDPTPGTSQNEFKEEHYRRIAYANRHFGTPSGKPGWRTDRGHMYIVYGPPDEIDSHPKPADGASAYEMWRYRHIEGLGDNGAFTFVDRTGNRDYQLAPVTTP